MYYVCLYVGLRARRQVGRIKIEMEPRDRTRAYVNCRARGNCFILGMYTNMIQTARTIVTIVQRWETIKITYYFFSRKLIGWFGVKWLSVLSRFSRTRKIPWALALESTTFQYLIVSNYYYILSIGFPYRGKSQMRIYVQSRGHSFFRRYLCLGIRYMSRMGIYVIKLEWSLANPTYSSSRPAWRLFEYRYAGYLIYTYSTCYVSSSIRVLI